MDVIHADFRVGFRYGVHFTRGVFGEGDSLLADLLTPASPGAPADIVAVVDDGVARAHAGIVDALGRYADAHRATMRLAAPVLVVPGGEISKNDPRHLEAVQRHIHDAALCRHSYVVAVGGGAVLDVVGYAASIAHRGIRLVRVPTTVLAQDDSGIGVKNGVNAYGKKNYFGVFAPPYAVVNDFDFLATLSDRDWISGIVEAVKVALIKDADFFDYIEAHADALVARDEPAMEHVIRRSAALHLTHIAGGGDPFELGSSRPLDFGHWAAHRLESLSDSRVRHGEAVAIGIAIDSTYACLTGVLGEDHWRRIMDLFLALGLHVYAPELDAHPDPSHAKSLFRGLAEFREHLGGQLTLMFLRAIGQAFDAHHVDTGALRRSIALLKQIDAARSSADMAGLVAPTTARATS